MNQNKLIQKLFSTIKNPSYLRNFIFGKMKYFPAQKITNQTFLDIPVYCISLKEASARRAFMIKQANKAGVSNLQFIDAVDSAILDYKQLSNDGLYDDSLAKKYHKRSLNLGEIACSLSHGHAYQTISKANHAAALILEDDALFVTKRINDIDLFRLPPNWDIVFLNSFYSKIPPEESIDKGIYTTKSWEGSCAAYLISQNCAVKLSKAYKPVIHAADGLVGRCMKLSNNQQHHFKQEGGTTTIEAYLLYPDPILNGSSVGFWSTTLPIS